MSLLTAIDSNTSTRREAAAGSWQAQRVTGLPRRLCVVDPDPALAQWFRERLAGLSCEISAAADLNEAAVLVASRSPHAILLGSALVAMDGKRGWAHIHALAAGASLILISDQLTASEAVAAMRAGAFDILARPLSEDDVLAVLARLDAAHGLVRADKDVIDVTGLGRMITRSRSVLDVFEIVRTTAAADVSVLILGENGTGKELIATALHDLSARRHRPFVRINCAAIPQELLESELFGHRRGAFTGADVDRKGLLAEANGGSVLLDEIGEMSLGLQVKLLRVLQDREVRALGDTRTTKVDFRLMCATNAEPRAAIADGRLRQDLFFRINTVTVRVPALRDRPADVELLAQTFLERFRQRYSREVDGFDASAMRALLHHTWPGNVRELEHAVESAVLITRRRRITSSDLPETVRNPRPRHRPWGGVVPPGCSLEELERLAILQALEQTNWNKLATAKVLGIHRPTLYNKLHKYHLTRRAALPPADDV